MSKRPFKPKCFKCNEETEEAVAEVGKFGTQRGGKHPLKTLIGYVEKQGLPSLAAELKDNLKTKEPTFIHKSCRTKLRNQSRETKEEKLQKENAPPTGRKHLFDFKTQCFYCEKPCIYDCKHPDRNRFEMVRTKDTGIYKTTVELCKVRDDQMAKNISVRLLSLNDLVHAEARYHTKCRSSFENPVPQNATPGRPVSSEKLRCFEKACAKLEEDTELYTITEFHELMKEFGQEEVYTVRMTVEKLKSRYGSSVEFINRKGRSNLIMIDKAKEILSEKWYNQKRHSDVSKESQRIIKTAAQLLKQSVRNFDHTNNFYPSVDEISESNVTPELLRTFVGELVKSELQQNSISQILFNAIRPRSLMPLPFALAVATNNYIESKWMSNVLFKLGFAVSYDEVSESFLSHPLFVILEYKVPTFAN